jgi:hypothetical protein
MISTQELIRWAQTLNPDSGVAVDDGGLTLVELYGANTETGAYLEVGGIPLNEDEDEDEDEDALEEALNHLRRAHPYVTYAIDGKWRTDDIAGAGYDLAQAFGFDHENGCELWEGQGREFGNGKVEVGVVVSSDVAEAPGLGMLWVGRMETVREGDLDFAVFRIEEVSRCGLVVFFALHTPEGNYRWIDDGKEGHEERRK